MSTHRVIVRRGDDVLAQGTAWVIGEGTVCTAFHVVGDCGERKWLHQQVVGTRYLLEIGATPQALTALVFDADADLALLSCNAALGTALPLAKLSRLKAQWKARAFPEFRGGKQITLDGTVVDLRQDGGAAAIQLWIKQGSDVTWEGASGAAVMDGPGVMAVLTRVTTGVSTAWAAPVEALHRLVELAAQVQQAQRLVATHARAGSLTEELVGADHSQLRQWLLRRPATQESTDLLAAVESNALPFAERELPAALAAELLKFGVVPERESDKAIHPIAADEFREFMKRHASFGGRHQQLLQIDQWLARQPSGYFFVTGTSGMGKTSLLVHWIEMQRRQGSTLCFHFFTPRVQQALEARHALQRLTEQLLVAHQLAGEPPNNDQARLRALYAKLLELPAPGARPLIVVLDGLDEALNTLQPGPALFPPSLGLGVHVLFSARETAGRRWLDDLGLAPDQVDQIELDRLSAADIAELLAQDALTPSKTAAVSQALRQKTDGDPFYVGDALRAWRQGGRDLQAIDALPATHSAYLEGWWTNAIQENTQPGFVDLMGTLAALREPLAAREIVAVSKANRFDSAHINLLIQTAARYIDDDRQGRYSLRHDRIRAFVREKLGDDARAHDERVADFAMHWNDPKASAETRAYGQRQLIPHLRALDDVERLHALLNPGAWADQRLRREPSGKTLYDDLQQLREATEERNRSLIAQSLAPDIWRDIAVAIDLASLTTRSSHISAALLRALVVSKHWSAETALSNLDLIEGESQVAEVLSSLAPILDDDALVTRALKKLGAGQPGWTGVPRATAALLRRRCELSAALIEPVLEEIKALDKAPRALALSEVSDLLPATRWREAADWLLHQTEYTALAGLLERAPLGRLASGMKRATQAAQARHIEPLKRVIERLAGAGQWRRARKLIDGAKLREDHTAVLIALLASCMGPNDPARIPWTDEALALSRKGRANGGVDEDVLEHAFAVLDADRQARLLQENLFGLDGQFLPWAADPLKAMIPGMRTELLLDPRELIARFESPDRVELAQSIAIRLVELGVPEAALREARREGDSYDRGENMVALLPHLARHGHLELAVTQAVNLAQTGRDHQLPGALAAVAPYTDAALFDRLLQRAQSETNLELRRKALQLLAPRCAELGRPEEALRMAYLISDAQAVEGLLARSALHWSQGLQDTQRALDEALQLSKGFTQLCLIGELGPALTAAQIEQALPTVLLAKGEVWQADTLERLLPRLAHLGQHETASLTALTILQDQQDRGNTELLAQVAAASPPADRQRLLRVAMEWVQSTFAELSNLAIYNLAHLVCAADEPLLQTLIDAFEAHDDGDHHTDARDKFVQAVVLREAQLGSGTHGLAWAQEQLDPFAFAFADTVGQVAHVLDLDTVWLCLDPAWSPRFISATLPRLLARLNQLGQTDAALARLADTSEDLRRQTIALLAGHVPAPRLRQLEALLPRVQHNPPRRQNDTSDRHNASGAIALAYAKLGCPEDALRVVKERANRYEIGTALTPIASHLPDHLLDEATALLKTSLDKDEAEAALLGRQSRDGGPGYLKAQAKASSLFAHQKRPLALAAIASQVPASAQPSMLYDGWSRALRALASNGRGELLNDLAALLPLAVRLGGPSVLENIKNTLAEAQRRWP